MTQTVPPESPRDLRALPDPTDARAIDRGDPLRGPTGHRRPGRDARAHPRRPAVRRPHPPRGRPRSGQDPDDQDPRRRPRRVLQARPVHPGPDAVRPRRHAHLPPRSTATFETELGPVFANFLLADEINRAPAKVQSRAARGHAGAPGHDRPHDLPGPGAVHRPRDREPDRGRGHLSRCPRPSSTGSCSRSCSTTRTPPRRRRSSPARCAGASPPREILDADGLTALQATVDDVYVDPRIISYAVALVEATRRLDLLGRPGARVVRRLRRQPAWLDQPRPRRARPRGPARPPLRAAVRRRRARARRPAPPPGHELLRADRRHHPGLGHHRASSGSSRRRSSTWPRSPRRDRPRPGRQPQPDAGSARPGARSPTTWSGASSWR